jgi:hypothetical protein
MFACWVLEIEVERVINSLKGNSSARFDEIPQFLVVYVILKNCSLLCNISVKAGFFFQI